MFPCEVVQPEFFLTLRAWRQSTRKGTERKKTSGMERRQAMVVSQRTASTQGKVFQQGDVVSFVSFMKHDTIVPDSWTVVLDAEGTQHWIDRKHLSVSSSASGPCHIPWQTHAIFERETTNYIRDVRHPPSFARTQEKSLMFQSAPSMLGDSPGRACATLTGQELDPSATDDFCAAQGSGSQRTDSTQNCSEKSFSRYGYDLDTTRGLLGTEKNAAAGFRPFRHEISEYDCGRATARVTSGQCKYSLLPAGEQSPHVSAEHYPQLDERTKELCTSSMLLQHAVDDVAPSHPHMRDGIFPCAHQSARIWPVSPAGFVHKYNRPAVAMAESFSDSAERVRHLIQRLNAMGEERKRAQEETKWKREETEEREREREWEETEREEGMEGTTCKLKQHRDSKHSDKSPSQLRFHENHFVEGNSCSQSLQSTADTVAGYTQQDDKCSPCTAEEPDNDINTDTMGSPPGDDKDNTQPVVTASCPADSSTLDEGVVMVKGSRKAQRSAPPRTPPGSQSEECHEHSRTTGVERDEEMQQEKEDGMPPEASIEMPDISEASIAMLDIFGLTTLKETGEDSQVKETGGDSQETSASTEMVTTGPAWGNVGQSRSPNTMSKTQETTARSGLLMSRGR